MYKFWNCFVDAGGEGVSDRDGSPVPERHGVGLMCDCPCGKCGELLFVGFANPLDGGSAHAPECPKWTRTGETFEVLTLTPSILRAEPLGCGWHGYITNGEVLTV
jgi:hypothetical protein